MFLLCNHAIKEKCNGEYYAFITRPSLKFGGDPAAEAEGRRDGSFSQSQAKQSPYPLGRSIGPTKARVPFEHNKKSTWTYYEVQSLDRPHNLNTISP